MGSQNAPWVSAAPGETPIRELPVIDLARADDPAQAEDFRADLLRASRDVGFFYLTGHGIDAARMAEMLDIARRLFALPDAAKRRVQMVNSPAFRGFTLMGGELTRGRTDWREQIDVGISREQGVATAEEPFWVLQGPNLWPDEIAADLPTVERWITDLYAVAMRLMRQWALALGQPAHVWDATFEDRPAPLLKLVRYAPAPDTTPEDLGQGVGGHKDGGVLTLLMPEPGTTGLQVESAGEWVDAPPREGAFVVNIGELLEAATEGLLKATEHRVVSPAPGTERMSIPYFHGPGLGGTFPALDLPAELAAYATGVSQEAHNAISHTYGRNSLKSRLRAHPDVAQRHHADLLG